MLVKADSLNHLEYEWDSPVWKPWIQFFSSHCRFIRYDEREPTDEPAMKDFIVRR